MRPKSIIRFDWLYLASIMLGLINFGLSYDATMADLQTDPAAAELGMAGSGFVIGVLAVSMAISLLLWFLVSHKASNAAKWVLTVLAAFGLVTMPFSLGALPPFTMVVTLLVTAVQVAAIWFLFQPDAKAWFTHGPQGMSPDVFE